MTKATGDGCYKLLATEGRTGEPIGRAVELGSYTYIPAPKHSATTVSGTLTKGGLPVTLRVTEPLLREFLEAMSRLEVELSHRWGCTQDSASPCAE